MRILFAASSQIAIPSLLLLLQEGADWDLVGILSSPPASRGRCGSPVPSDLVQAFIKARGDVAHGKAEQIAILCPETLDACVRKEISSLAPDLLVTFSYGKIFGPKFLSLFPLGGINIHPSLLPALRGPCPIPAAIEAGLKETGISIQKIALKMDCGEILATKKLPLDGRETCATLSDRVAVEAPPLLETVLRSAARNELRGEPQDEAQASYCHILQKDDGHIQWNASAEAIDAKIRAYTPWPSAFTYWNDERLSLLESIPYPDSASPQVPDGEKAGTVLGIDKSKGILIQTGGGVLSVQKLQRSARKPLDWKSFINGNRCFIGSLLT